jgi:hypothetical protein
VRIYLFSIPLNTQYDQMHGPTRETRDGWPLVSVETEANGDLKSERGPSLARSMGSSCLYIVQEIFVLPWLL